MFDPSGIKKFVRKLLMPLGSKVNFKSGINKFVRKLLMPLGSKVNFKSGIKIHSYPKYSYHF